MKSLQTFKNILPYVKISVTVNISMVRFPSISLYEFYFPVTITS